MSSVVASLRGSRSLTAGSAALVAALAVNGAGGLLFWVLAVRSTNAEAVGAAVALLQIALLVNYATSLGLPTLLAWATPRRSGWSHRTFRRAAALRILASLAGVLTFVAVARSAEQFVQLRSYPGATVVFGLLTAGAGLAVLVEVRLVALRLWHWIIIRAGAVAIGRLVLLPLVPTDDPEAGLLALGLGLPALSGFVGALVLWRFSGSDDAAAAPAARGSAATNVRYASANWLSLLSTQGPNFLLPVVVSFRVPDEELAPFYIAWSVGLLLFQVPHLVGTVLISESESGIERHERRYATIASVAICSIATLAAVIFAPVLRRFSGDGFDDLTVLLPLVVGATVFWSFTSMALAEARARSDNRSSMILGVAFLLLAGGPAILSTASTTRTAFAWLVGTAAAAAATQLYERSRRSRQ